MSSLNTPAAHAGLNQFQVVDNVIHVNGVSLTQLAARIGQTPFYAYPRDALTARVKALRAAMPKTLGLHYAMKANPMPAVVQHFSTLVDGIDVASALEMQVALDTGMPAKEISFAGPGKRKEEIIQAVAAGITINVESTREIVEANLAGIALNVKPRLALRVNPDFELKSSGMKMGGGPKQFGLDVELIPDALKMIHTCGAVFVGFHIYAGSQNLKADSLADAHTKTVDLALRLCGIAKEIGHPAPQVLNIGGGFGIQYFPGDAPLDLAAVGAHLGTLMPKLHAALPGTEVLIELGRYLVGEAGLYCCKIIDKKISRGVTFLVTDGGLHHHLAASGNFGQVIRKNYPVVLGNRVSAETLSSAYVVGPLCTPLDVLGDKVMLPEADVGDLVCVLQSGAYGLTASPTRFLSHPQPFEVLV
jgi:diaminopimelate decarboxylase